MVLININSSVLTLIDNNAELILTRSAFKKRRGLVKMNVQLLTQFILEVCRLIRP